MEAVRDLEVGMLLDPASPLRRYFEDLAENLLEMGDAGTVVVTSPEPGAGCTSVCLGLASALAGMERKTAVVDLNLQSPHLHKVLGEPNFVGLTSAFAGDKPLESYGHEVLPGMLVLPTGPVSPSSVTIARNRRFVEKLRGLEDGRDFVLLDSPPVPEVIATPRLSHGFDGVLLVVHASRTSKRVAREATDDLLDADANLLGVVLNGCT